MAAEIELRARFPVDDRVLSALHAAAFDFADAAGQPWAERLAAYSLTWIGAFDGEALVGFVHVCWDGGSHAFLLDPAVDPVYQRRGIGRDLVRAAAQTAADAGCQWLHVDYEPHLQSFYEQACGFAPTSAGLLRLRP